MDGVEPTAPGGALRVLLAVAGALGGAVLCVLLGSSAAHADVRDDSSGLISVVQAVGNDLDTAGSTPPAPAQDLPTFGTIVAPVATATDRVVASVPVVAPVVTDVVGSTPVSDAAAPVTGLLDRVVGVPVGVVAPPTGPVHPDAPAPLPDAPAPLPDAPAPRAADRDPLAQGGPDLPGAVLGLGVAAAGDVATEAPAPTMLAGSESLAGAHVTGALPASLTSSGGAGPSAGVLASSALATALLLLVRRRVHRVFAPPRPVSDTDSSPD